MRKITFEVIVADNFNNLPDNGVDDTHLWPIPSVDSQRLMIDLKFSQTSKDAMKEAESVLDIYMKKNYPNKKYKIYYWWWKN